jgi:hypothetical protein
MRTRMATLNAQLDATWRSAKVAPPRSRRRVKLESVLINIQLKRLKADIKAGRAGK